MRQKSALNADIQPQIVGICILVYSSRKVRVWCCAAASKSIGSMICQLFFLKVSHVGFQTGSLEWLGFLGLASNLGWEFLCFRIPAFDPTLPLRSEAVCGVVFESLGAVLGARVTTCHLDVPNAGYAEADCLVPASSNKGSMLRHYMMICCREDMS